MLRAEVFYPSYSEVRYLETEGEMLYALELLARANEAYFRAHPELPHPYRWGGLYRREGKKEQWLSAPYILEAIRAGKPVDCEDWSALLAGWYRARRRERAKVVLLRQHPRRGGLSYHALVMLPGRRLKDPSKALGMKAV